MCTLPWSCLFHVLMSWHAFSTLFGQTLDSFTWSFGILALSYPNFFHLIDLPSHWSIILPCYVSIEPLSSWSFSLLCLVDLVQPSWSAFLAGFVSSWKWVCPQIKSCKESEFWSLFSKFHKLTFPLGSFLTPCLNWNPSWFHPILWLQWAVCICPICGEIIIMLKETLLTSFLYLTWCELQLFGGVS